MRMALVSKRGDASERELRVKTLTLTGYQHYKDAFWRPSKMEMVNHQTGRSTVLHWSDYRFDTGLTEADFNQNSMMRAR